MTPAAGKALGDQVGRRAPPIDLPARRVIGSCAEEFAGGALGFDQPLGSIGSLRAPLGVGIVEGHHRMARIGQRIGGSHERMFLIRPGTVGDGTRTGPDP